MWKARQSNSFSFIQVPCSIKFYMNYHLLYINHSRSFTRAISSLQTHTQKTLSSASWSPFSRQKTEVWKGYITCPKSKCLKIKEASFKIFSISKPPAQVGLLPPLERIVTSTNTTYLFFCFFLIIQLDCLLQNVLSSSLLMRRICLPNQTGNKGHRGGLLRNLFFLYFPFSLKVVPFQQHLILPSSRLKANWYSFPPPSLWTLTPWLSFLCS